MLLFHKSHYPVWLCLYTALLVWVSSVYPCLINTGTGWDRGGSRQFGRSWVHIPRPKYQFPKVKSHFETTANPLTYLWSWESAESFYGCLQSNLHVASHLSIKSQSQRCKSLLGYNISTKCFHSVDKYIGNGLHQDLQGQSRHLRILFFWNKNLALIELIPVDESRPCNHLLAVAPNSNPPSLDRVRLDDVPGVMDQSAALIQLDTEEASAGLMSDVILVRCLVVPAIFRIYS